MTDHMQEFFEERAAILQYEAGLPKEKAEALAAAELRTWQNNQCRKCGGVMEPGKAIEQTYTGLPDFPGDRYAVTVSPGGPGKLVDCLKCSACGWSVTP